MAARPSPETVTVRGGLVRPKRFFLVLGAALYALVLPTVVIAFATHVYPLLAFLVHASLFGGMSVAYGARSTKGAAVREGRLEVSPAGITLDGEVLARRSALVQGFYQPTDDGLHVRFERRRSLVPLVLRVPDEATADAVLETLGFDAKHTAARMRVASGLLAMPVGAQMAMVIAPMLAIVPLVLALAALLGKLVVPFAFVFVAAYLAYTFALAFAPTTVLVGTDGFIQKWLLSSTFFPFSRVTGVTTYKEQVGGKQQRGVRVRLTGGDEVRLPTGQTDVGDVEAASLAARIEQARRAHAEGARGLRTEVLDRGHMEPRDWVRALRRLGEGAHDHRTAAVPIEVLLRRVEDGSATAEERVSAAIAATSGGDPEATRRVRVAAEATASPRLRVALETVSDTGARELSEEALSEALAAAITLDRGTSTRARRSS